ncbi:uncharacterized protein LOC123295852 [Chrysoperla carnea]|uniref:uncharacterized protein LOC123295852 n=1 Tax=Chrysoperla carnea TaxID=189513 RepID=UPI001D09022C|nr:uncharacterized protein LOC123295852 [Chrysoperla carnea]
MEMDLHEDYFPMALSFCFGGALNCGFTMTRDIQKIFFVKRSKTIRHQFESFLYRRFYTYCFLIATILHWRSGWLILDSLNDYFHNKNANAIAGIICWILLVVFRSTRNVFAPPLLIALDTEKLSFVYPTRFKTDNCHNSANRLSSL